MSDPRRAAYRAKSNARRMARYHILRRYGVKGSVASDISGCAVEFVSWLKTNGHDPETHREAWEPHRRGPPQGAKYARR